MNELGYRKMKLLTEHGVKDTSDNILTLPGPCQGRLFPTHPSLKRLSQSPPTGSRLPSVFSRPTAGCRPRLRFRTPKYTSIPFLPLPPSLLPPCHVPALPLPPCLLAHSLPPGTPHPVQAKPTSPHSTHLHSSTAPLMHPPTPNCPHHFHLTPGPNLPKHLPVQ